MNENPYTKSNRKNPENTGSLWCAKNVEGWSNTTHQKYYKEDPQVDLGGVVLTIVGVLFALLILVVLCFAGTEPHWGAVLLAIPTGIVIGMATSSERKK